MKAKDPNKQLEQIAKQHLFIETLETQHSDRLDFHDVSETLESLTKAGLIAQRKRAIVLTKAAYAALGIDQPSQPAKAPGEIKTRENSKQAQVIELLNRPEGATIKQICEATGWQQHTVRGAFAGSFKKKLGLVITSNKDDNSDRVYRIA